MLSVPSNKVYPIAICKASAVSPSLSVSSFFSSLSAVSQNSAKNQPLFLKLQSKNRTSSAVDLLGFSLGSISLSLLSLSPFTVPSIYLHLHFVLMLPNIDLWLCVSTVTVALSTALRLWVLPPLCVYIGSVCAQACDYDASVPLSLSLSVSLTLRTFKRQWFWFGSSVTTHIHIFAVVVLWHCVLAVTMCVCVSVSSLSVRSLALLCVLSPSQCLHKVDAAVNAAPPPVRSC